MRKKNPAENGEDVIIDTWCKAFSYSIVMFKYQISQCQTNFVPKFKLKTLNSYDIK